MSLPLLLAGAAAVLFAALWLRARSQRRTADEQVEKLRTRLDRAHAARETFFDLATHELRSPLSAILGYQELLGDGAYGGLDEGASEPVERIGRSARHLLHLIDGVVEISRLRSGTVRPDLGPVDLGVLLSSVAEAFRTAASERGLDSRVTIPDRLPTVRSDQERLVRALDLVVTSAVKHPAGSVITLEVENLESSGADPRDDSRDDSRIVVRIAETEIEPREEAGDPALRLGIRLAVAEGIAGILGGQLALDTGEDGRIRRLAFHIGDTPTAESNTTAGSSF